MIFFTNLLRPHARLRRQLDAYIDGESGAKAAARFEAHLRRCPECSLTVERAHSMKAALRAMPAYEVPRSFALTPAMAGVRAPGPDLVPRARFVRPMRFAAGLAAIALAVVAVVDTWPGGGDDGSASQAAGLPFADTAERQAAPAGAPAGSPVAVAKATAAAAPRALSTPAAGGASASSVENQASPSAVPSGLNAFDSAPAATAVAREAGRDDDAAVREPGAAPFASTGASDASGDDGRFPAIRLVELGLVAFLAADAGLMLLRRRVRRS